MKYQTNTIRGNIGIGHIITYCSQANSLDPGPKYKPSKCFLNWSKESDNLNFT